MRASPRHTGLLLVGILLTGCTPTSGLLFRPGPHIALPTAEEFAQAASHPIPIPRELSKEVLPEYRIEPGDIVVVEMVEVTSTERLPGDQTVKPDGTIDLGRYGPLTVVGKTVEQIQADAQLQILRFQTQEARSEGTPFEQDSRPPEINVRLIEPTSKVYYVTGEVNSPGAFRLIGRETVLDAIVEAGDLTDRANRHKIFLSRPSSPAQCRLVLPVCYRQIVQLGDTTTNYQIQPGDRIFVSSMTFWEEIGQCLFPHIEEQCPACLPRTGPCLHHRGACNTGTRALAHCDE
jgi:polysaccharide export outer membrane protein